MEYGQGRLLDIFLTQRVYTGAVIGGKTRILNVGSDERKILCLS